MGQPATTNATAIGSGRSAPGPTTRMTGAPMTAVGGTPQRPTTTGVMTTGSPATNSTPGIGAKKTMEAATTSGSGRIAPGCTTEILARARETPSAAGSTGMTGGRKNSGWTATSSGPGTGAGDDGLGLLAR